MPPPAPTDQESDAPKADSKHRPHLSREQEALRDALGRFEPRLGRIYVGGLRVLEDDSNPEWLAQSAHSMRELMEKIEGRFARVTDGNGGGGPPVDLTHRVIAVKDLFWKRRKKTTCHSDESGWNGEIDPHLRKILIRLDAFFQWFAKVRPLRRELFERMLIGLDPSGLAFSTPLVSSSWKQWKEIRGFFVGVSHHSKDTDLETLRARIDDLEVFLSDRLLPSTSRDLDSIDSLIEESRDA